MKETEKFYSEVTYLIDIKYYKILQDTAEDTFLRKGLDKFIRAPYMYGMPKLHKKRFSPTEPKYRPVIV